MTLSESDHFVASADAEEAIIAEAGEFWARPMERPGVQDMAHWPGAGRWADLEKWKAIGMGTLGHLKTLCILTGHSLPVRSLVEWGPGGGANVVALESLTSRFYGVDISASTLDICGKVATQIGFAGFSPICIDIAAPEQVVSQIPEPVELFLSTAVFQHFPSRAYTQRVLRIASRLLAPDGVALIQTRYDDGSEQMRPKQGDYSANVVQFLSFRVEEFWALAATCGFEPLAVHLDPSVSYAYYYMTKRV